MDPVLLGKIYMYLGWPRWWYLIGSKDCQVVRSSQVANTLSFDTVVATNFGGDYCC